MVFGGGRLQNSSQSFLSLGKGPRVVRVGTHAVSSGSQSTLWSRLSTHRGNLKTGGGNHRGSIFRLLIGEALANSQADFSMATWGQGSSADRVNRDAELSLGIEVSRHLRQMPFLWLRADDDPSASSVRGIIERNAMGLLSNYQRLGTESIDPPSENWLGRHSLHQRVRESGLWNNNHVDEKCDSGFFSILDALIRQTV
jgi:hypothetical protein